LPARQKHNNNMKKTLKNMQSLLAVAGIVALGATASAQPDPIIENVIASTSSAMVEGTLTFDIPQFNPSLGTLNSVELTLTPTPETIYPSDYSSIVQTITDASVNSPSGSLVDDSSLGLTASWSGVQSPPGQEESIVFAAPGLENGTPQTFSFTAPPASVAVGPAGFVGGGDYDLSFTSTATATSEGTGTVGDTYVSWNGTISGTLEVEYDYTVPEPTTISLLATGLLGALTVRRRKV
jgi:hypothetical protein